MCKVIAISNQKGGVGKTTTAIQLGAGLANRGKRVLLIDMDQQGNLTDGLGILSDSLSNTISSVMRKVLSGESEDKLMAYLKDYVILTHSEGMDFVPSNTELAGLEPDLWEKQPAERNYILKKIITLLRPNYDYILIDTQPSLGLFTINAFCAADSVIVPLPAQFFSLKGFKELHKTISRIQKKLNPSLSIEGILLTRVKPRTKMQRSIIEQLQEKYGSALHIYEAVIPETVRLEETVTKGQSIYVHDKRGKAAAAYGNLVEEVLRNE